MREKDLVPRDFVVFGDDWGHHPSTIQHIGKVLAKNNRLLWVGSLGLRRPRFSSYDVLRVLNKGRKILARPADTLTVPNMHVLFPPVIPFHDIRVVRNLNAINLFRAIREKMANLGFRQPTILTTSPIVGDLIDRLRPASSHYLCLDDWTQFDGAFACLGTLEQELLSRVDSCFAVSESLLKSRKALTGENHYLPQGVDINHFAQPARLPAPAVASLPRPIVGYFGLLASFTNLELLAAAARHYPEVTFLVIGRRLVDAGVLEAPSNLHYIGEVPFDILPMYAQVIDVGLIPFRINPLTIAANPLKLLEYFALGARVVATDLPELRRFMPHVLIGQDEQEFIHLIRIALDERSEKQQQALRSVAAGYSWERITASIMDVVRRVEENKSRTQS